MTNSKSNLAHRAYCYGLFTPFKRIEDGVFRVRTHQDAIRIKRWLKADSELWRVENDWNHFHFDMALSSDPVENFKINRLLAEAGMALWSSNVRALSSMTKVIIINELHEIEVSSKKSYFDIYPTLRVWTRSDCSCPLDELYQGNAADVAFDLNSFNFIPLTNALTKIEVNG